ncbi:MAG TPA: phosphate acyltransferase PlsX [Bacteroidia bacterium]|nr:phosphate acyltransferase PlsX [Bacteroidia bacterium]
MKIGIDVMGGDYAPQETVRGAVLSRAELPDSVELVLIGDSIEIHKLLKEYKADTTQYTIVHANDVIGMGDNPARAVVQKPDSSISIGFRMLKDGEIDSFASAGNSGAMLVGAVLSVKMIPGIIRPCLSSIIPKENGGLGFILDVGANADCKPEMLQQFAIIGSLLAEYVYHIPKPKVGLMNIGEEDEKGNTLSKESFQLIKNLKDINFVGNVEGRDLFNDKTDVIVCDGFTGNVILKLAESFYFLLRKHHFNNDYFERFNYENYGGTPVLGVNAPVIIGHGISNAKTIKNMILFSKEIIDARLSEKISEELTRESIVLAAVKNGE